ncbi:cytochrome P450 [Aspergillus pseudonomiae]|uniref:Cytochrome P450 n=1 Tax=Aspergillus pseudonomiae TaxID=1506151 RepID=A0A5N7CV68_9EURO|nr:cytochrome P450 [Aspergillus pseudonomiae]KAE8398031.1 cytochrome P450 [Aspergillus pseudonomiae]
METTKVVILLTLVLLCYCASILRRPKRPLPPGPPRLPLIGNLHQYPKSEPWKTYQKWHKKYGPIMTVKYGPQTIIMLGTSQATRDILEKRSERYSSRPRMVVAERVTKNLQTSVMPYGKLWRIHRRLQTSLLSNSACQFYHEIQEVESHQLLFDLLSTNDFSDRFRRFSASLLFTLAYGKRMPRGDEHEVQEIDLLIKNLMEVVMMGNWLVDLFPQLEYLPRRLSKWKQVADGFHDREVKLFTQNLRAALERGNWNWTKALMGVPEAQNLTEKELSYVIGFLYEAGSDTTTSVLEVFMLATVLHPDAVRTAQLELDTVVGQHRLPSFEDMSKLPFTMAFVKEVLRWRPIVTAGVPRLVEQDDEYMGYHIPKGSVVIANSWSLYLDDDMFEDADSFSPERWIQNPNLQLSGFGFGRRGCVGKHLTVNSLNIIIARLLWAYDIKPEKNELVDAFRMKQVGLVSRPMPFRALFQVRSPSRESVIRSIGASSQEATDEILDRIQANVAGAKVA